MKNNPDSRTDSPHVCSYRFAFLLDNWIRRLIQAPGRIIGPYIQEGNTVVDMGCGPGYFTIDMAKMVGPKGRVVAVDIQKGMLERVRKKAQKHAVIERIDFYRAGTVDVSLNQTADFILAFYMIHEVPDMRKMLEELKRLLHPGGKILAVEPKMHVSQARFKRMLDCAGDIGLTVLDYPKRAGGRSVVWSA